MSISAPEAHSPISPDKIERGEDYGSLDIYLENLNPTSIEIREFRRKTNDQNRGGRLAKIAIAAALTTMDRSALSLQA